MEDEIVDSTTQTIDTGNPESTAAISSEKPDLSSILAEAGLDTSDPELVKSQLTELREIRETVGSKEDLAALLADAKEANDIKVARTIEAEITRRAKESPDETIDRLDRELKAIAAKDEEKRQAITRKEESTNAVKGYDSAVSELVGKTEATEAEKKFLGSILASTNPIIEVDLKDRKAIAKMVESQRAVVKSFADDVIAEYVAGKRSVPVVGKPGAATSPQAGKAAKTPEEANERFASKLAALFKQ